jgi:prostaglandin-H2 D-isomerase / glutathione transferase
VADVYIDWRFRWVENLSTKSNEYKNDIAPKYYSLVGEFYAQNNAGPYLLGDRITYVDYAVYQSADNDRRTGTLPETLSDSIVALMKAMEARPNIAGYIKDNM